MISAFVGAPGDQNMTSIKFVHKASLQFAVLGNKTSDSCMHTYIIVSVHCFEVASFPGHIGTWPGNETR